MCGLAGSAEAAYPGSDGRIAFQSGRDVAAGEIYTITPGGSATRLTNSNGNADPVYSPDGSRIAFVSSDNQISVMNADGTDARPVTKGNTPKRSPTWSPDGTRIAFVSNSFDVDGQTDLEIWSINVDGSGRTQLTDNSFPDTKPAWSPGGGRIAFVSARAGDTNTNVYVMNADGGNQMSITPNSPPGCSPTCYQGNDEDPAWSPDGSTIAYVHGHTRSGGGLPDIWTMGPLGGGKTNLTNNDDVADWEPAWSPSGTRIAYQGIATDNNPNIYVMNANGSAQAPIETNGAEDEQPDWQPIPVCTEMVSADNDPLVGTGGDDVLCGDARDNVIRAGGGNDFVMPRGGDDRLTGGFGNDVLNGAPGADAVLYSGLSPVHASLATGFATGQGSDVLLGVEGLTGSDAGDVLIGSADSNVLVGDTGADTLFGLAGADLLNSRDGVSGNDTLNGGLGGDTCVRDATEASVTSCP